MKFPLEFLEDLDTKIVEKTIIGQRRWTTQFRVVFTHDDKWFEWVFSRGSTECQENDDWDEAEEIECPEVFPVKKTVTVYERKPD